MTALLTGALAARARAAVRPAAGGSVAPATPGRIPAASKHAPDVDSVQAAFAANVHSAFAIQAWFGAVSLELVAVDDRLPQADAQSGREWFSLVFEGDAAAFLSQDTYPVDHPVLGRFPLFLVPGAADSIGRQQYVAIVNRLTNSPPLLEHGHGKRPAPSDRRLETAGHGAALRR